MDDIQAAREESLIAKLQNIGLWAAVVGMILLLVAQFLSGSTNENIKTIDELAKEIGFALLIAAVLVFTTERRSKVEFNRLFDGHIARFDGEMSSHIVRFNGEMNRRLLEFYGTVNVTKVTEELHRSENQEIKRIGSRIYEAYLNGLRAIPGGFHVDEVNWTLESNRIFYECLNESDCKNSEIRITHTGPIETWLNFGEARRTLEQQRKLINDKNMKIIRIFLGRESLEHSPQYQEVMGLMSDEYGIQCMYLQRENPSATIDMTWVPQLQLLSVWKPGIGLGVESVEVTPDQLHRDLNSEWLALLREGIAQAAQKPQNSP
jgi:hypothetical protein